MTRAAGSENERTVNGKCPSFPCPPPKGRRTVRGRLVWLLLENRSQADHLGLARKADAVITSGNCRSLAAASRLILGAEAPPHGTTQHHHLLRATAAWILQAEVQGRGVRVAALAQAQSLSCLPVGIGSWPALTRRPLDGIWIPRSITSWMVLAVPSSVLSTKQSRINLP